jgi:HEAT repeat protein
MRRWLLILGVLLLLAVAGVFLDPTRVVIGWMSNESFFQGRPSSYWERELRSREPAVRTNAIKELTDGGPAAIPVLVELIENDRPSANSSEVRWTAAATLSQMGPRARPALPALVDALQDSDPLVRLMAIKALGRIGREAAPALPALVPLLKCDEKLDVLKALQQIHRVPQTALPLLQHNLKDEQAEIRWRSAAVLALSEEPKDAVVDLVPLLEDKEASVRAHVAEALGEIGPEAKTALPILNRLLEDADEEVRDKARRAMGRIERAGSGP